MGQSEVTREDFGQHEDRPVFLWTLKRQTDIGPVSLAVTNYGATIQSLVLLDKFGTPTDIALGYDRLEDYVSNANYFGAVAGRYANRIRNGQIDLLGKTVQLDVNEGENHLHGGKHGFDKIVWDFAETEDGLVFRTTSPDGDMGYPGNLEVEVSYRITDAGALLVDFIATTDKTTICNVVQHSLWNLGGHASGTIHDHIARFAVDFYTPVDGTLIPTGELLTVTGTPFDFRLPKPIGRDLPSLTEADYDHNFVLGQPAADGLRDCTEITCPANGLGLRLRTTEPGVQFYVGSYLTPSVVGKGATPYRRNAGFALETQKFPASPNHAHFPSSVLSPGEAYHHRMELAFFHLD